MKTTTILLILLTAGSLLIAGNHINLSVIAPASSLHTFGSKILNTSNQEVFLRGVGWIHTDDDPTFWIAGYGVWNAVALEARVAWIANEGLNLIKIFVPAEWVLRNPVTFQGAGGTTTEDYLQHIEDLCSIADKYGVYVEVCFNMLINGKDTYTNGYAVCSTPYYPYTTLQERTIVPDTQTFHNAVGILASRLRYHNNALLGIWNEPKYTTGNQAEYDNYFSQLPISIQTARNNGFTGIIVVMGSMAFTPANFWLGGNDDMTWALNHLSLFTDYGSVVADFHAYYCFLHQYGSYPNTYTELEDSWFNKGKISQAQASGIPVVHFEDGVRYGDIDRDAQIVAYLNSMLLMNNYSMSYLGWCFSTSDSFRMLDSLSPYTWNAAGNALKYAIVSGEQLSTLQPTQPQLPPTLPSSNLSSPQGDNALLPEQNNNSLSDYIGIAMIGTAALLVITKKRKREAKS